MKQYLITVDDNNELFIEHFSNKTGLDQLRENLYPSDKDDICYDEWSGRYFLSNIIKLERAAMDLERQCMQEGDVSLNDYYDLIGLPPIPMGFKFGWSGGERLELRLGSTTTPQGRPALSVWFRQEPKPEVEWRAL